ncbi:MAG: hypothetical protein DYG93_12585 [Leptolyngbya sp. PLA2]|nr:hypothetical protein [Leptolyngbya sp.]MCE7972481.1 hypothetical protein [Leptolyngbya sp. PL-A2]MCQ3941136.1 hypothetical protein [cyanobacterium CYA1]MCZ7633202.1 hypothetical protein [Phycisphaerales bacterium]MDL1905420.1 hypothetical protein [Synechococcales cyanobacterium CNB]GIK18320.1 MAG: hypothetical protein BroJett004_04840 [Planctomycetota bacterium]
MSDATESGKSRPEESGPIPLGPEPEPTRPAPFKEGLLDDFDEDADLLSDPEVEAAIKGKPKTDRAKPDDEKPKERLDFVLPMPGGWRLPAILGTVALVAALVFNGLNTPLRPVALAVVKTLYETLMHTGTGVAAVMVASLLTERRFSRFEQAAGRMFLAVSAFALVVNLKVPIPGHIDEFVLAAVAYAGVVWSFFRLPPRETLILMACHFGMWLAVAAGGLLGGALKPVAA